MFSEFLVVNLLAISAALFPQIFCLSQQDIAERRNMLYRTDASPSEKLFSTGMPAAPDEQYAEEWSSIYVAMSRKYFPAEYASAEHPSRAVDVAVRAAMLRHRPVTSTLLETWRKETIELSNIFAKATGAHKGPSPAARNELVLGGALHIHREPNVLTKKNLFQHKYPAVPTPAIVPYPMEHRNASARFEWDNRIKARRECATALTDLGSAVDASSQKFIDYDFFVGEAAALYPPGTQPWSTVGEPRDVKSLRSVFPGVPLLGSLGQHVLVPGRCASHHLVIAVDSIMRCMDAGDGVPSPGEAMLMDLFVCPWSGEAIPLETVNEFFSTHGYVGVTLYVNGRWEWVVVDDMVPVDEHGDLLFMRCADSTELAKLHRRYEENKSEEPYLGAISPCAALWPSILEKALAKVHGSYDGIDGGSPRETIVTLTGAIEVGSAVLTDDLVAALQVDAAPTIAVYHDERANSYALQLGPHGSAPRLFSSLQISPPPVFDRARHVELLRFRPTEDVVIEICDVSSSDVPAEFDLRLSAPICANVMLCVEQADPRTNLHLPHELRRLLPLGLVDLSVVNSAGRIVSPTASLPTCRRQVGMVIGLEPGEYVVRVVLSAAPSVPFSLTMSCNGAATLSAVRRGHDMGAHGVTTRVVEQRRPASPPLLAGPRSPRPQSRQTQATPRAIASAGGAAVTRTDPAVAAAFASSDILLRGRLDERGAKRAFATYVLEHSVVGLRFQQLLAEMSDAEGGLSVTPEMFQRLVAEAFRSDM
jgi:hypothetical protein